MWFPDLQITISTSFVYRRYILCLILRTDVTRFALMSQGGALIIPGDVCAYKLCCVSLHVTTELAY